LAAFENHIGLQTRPPACGQDGREVEQSDSLVYFPEDRAADFVLLCRQASLSVAASHPIEIQFQAVIYTSSHAAD